jgi:hypothetical protein
MDSRGKHRADQKQARKEGDREPWHIPYQIGRAGGKHCEQESVKHAENGRLFKALITRVEPPKGGNRIDPSDVGPPVACFGNSL